MTIWQVYLDAVERAQVHKPANGVLTVLGCAAWLLALALCATVEIWRP